MIPILVPDTDAELLEAAVDIICKLAAVPGARPTLTSSVSCSYVAKILFADHSSLFNVRDNVAHSLYRKYAGFNFANTSRHYFCVHNCGLAKFHSHAYAVGKNPRAS